MQRLQTGKTCSPIAARSAASGPSNTGNTPSIAAKMRRTSAWRPARFTASR